jgi:hypothetical protein
MRLVRYLMKMLGDGNFGTQLFAELQGSPGQAVNTT